MHDSGCVQLVNDYTRITVTSKTLIDLVISNNKDISTTVLKSTEISDQSILEIQLFQEKLEDEKI